MFKNLYKSVLLENNKTVQNLQKLKGSFRWLSISSANKQQEHAKHIDDSDDLPDYDMPNPYEKEPRQCILCKYKVKINYKNTKLLSQFISPYTGRIYNKHITGLCEEQQTRVTSEISKSQNAGYMPLVLKESKFLKDPKLFDPFRPQRPHPH